MDQLTSKDYRDAIEVQDAVNLSGVVRSWMEIMSRMSGMPTEERNHHPINVMFSSKVANLSGYEGNEMEAFNKAYTVCKEKANEDI